MSINRRTSEKSEILRPFRPRPISSHFHLEPNADGNSQNASQSSSSYMQIVRGDRDSKVVSTLSEVSERLGQACNQKDVEPLAPSRSLSLQCLVRSPPQVGRSGISSSSGSLNSFLQLEREMVTSSKEESLGSFSLEERSTNVDVMKKSSSFWDSPTRRKKKKKKIPFLPPLVSVGRSSSATLTRNLSCQSLITESSAANYDRPCGESHTLPGSLSELTNSTSVSLGFSPTSSILPPITTKEARSRSFLVGRVSSRGSLLGVEEMTRYFPDKKLKIFVGTWNMNGQSTPRNLNDFLLPESVHLVPDMYIIGTQEGPSDRRDWEVGIQSCLGPSHVLFHSASLGVLHLAVFLRRDLIWFCSGKAMN